MRLNHHFPLTLTQPADLRKQIQKQAKTARYTGIAPSRLIRQLASVRLGLRRMDLQIEDWWDYSNRSFREACVTALTTIAKLEGTLRPLIGHVAMERWVEKDLDGTEAQIQHHLSE